MTAREFYGRVRSFMCNAWRITGPEFDRMAREKQVRTSDIWRELCFHGATAEKPDLAFDYLLPGYIARKRAAEQAIKDAECRNIAFQVLAAKATRVENGS